MKKVIEKLGRFFGHCCGHMDLSPAQSLLRIQVACMSGLFPSDRKEDRTSVGPGCLYSQMRTCIRMTEEIPADAKKPPI